MKKENYVEVEVINSNTSKKVSELSILDGISMRQKEILRKLPKYSKICIAIAILGFVLTNVLQVWTKTLPKPYLELISFEHPSLNSVITLILTIFSLLIIWLFVIWSITFVPFIAFRAHKTSIKIPLTIGTKSFKWLQLYASTLLPVIIFALAWTSLPKKESMILSITNYIDFLMIIGFAAGIWVLLWGLIKILPIKYVAIHLSLFSALLYVSIFIAYGVGFSIIAYSTLLGIVLFLTFSFNKIAEIGVRLSIYDIDENISENIIEISKKDNVMRVKEVEITVRKQTNEQELRISNLEEEENLSKQLNEIRDTKYAFNKQLNAVTLNVFYKKCELYKKMYDILATELEQKLDEEIPKKIKEIQENAKKYSPDELRLSMKDISSVMEASLNGIPESLEELKNGMNNAVKQLADKTKEISDSTFDYREKVDYNQKIIDYEQKIGDVTKKQMELDLLIKQNKQNEILMVKQLHAVGMSISDIAGNVNLKTSEIEKIITT